MKNKKLFFIISTSLITVILLYIFDQILQINYISKVGFKIIIFLLFPIIYIRKTKNNFIKDSVNNKKKIFRIKFSYILGVLLFVIIIVAFNLIKPYMNMEVMIFEFEEKYKINQDNILYYGLYLVFVNSLLEEFFFRGFIFLNLKNIGMKRTAYLTSAIAFSIYHISNFQNWFNIWVFALATTGLFIGGIIFNFLDDRENTFLNSWFVHICADVALVGIGLSLFEVI
ncbi:MAG: CPBP family intramembrane metalloprotease [Firmicutes bacterium HGW-Firmicutes-7]|nr:MAG: CPBP family intramembrane metalloprotease [Firmicutes bacterium HGW-Firmicutes-7]